ncbi:MAG: pyridoxal-phosphate dependent enzyme [Chloroflexota bacterium]
MSPEVRAYHASLPEYAPTPLVELPALARELGVGRVFVKDESSRLGLPAFKALGATWAVHRALAARGQAGDRAVTLVCATDGNHGRAVARTARLLGHRASWSWRRACIPTPSRRSPARARRWSRARSPTTTRLPGRRPAQAPDAILVQDMGWPGYEQIPAWIVEGYATLCAEADDQLAEAGARAEPVVVPVGVGSFAQAVVTHYRSRADGAAPALLAVEPTAAACVLESPRRCADDRRDLRDRDGRAQLRHAVGARVAGAPRRLDAAVAVDDEEDLRAVRDMAALGVAGDRAGPRPRGLRAVLGGDDASARRAALGLAPDAVVLLLNTEGAAANPHAARAGR